MERLKSWAPQNFDLRRRAGESFRVSPSHFENSQNLDLTSERCLLRSCAIAQLRNYHSNVDLLKKGLKH
jgi:hypothetical protein